MGPSQPDEPSTPARDARRDLALAWAVGFTMWGLLLSIDPLLPAIQAELALTFTLRSLVLALPFLSMAIAAIPGGFLADRSGIRRSVTLGGAIATGGAALRAVPGGTVLLLTAAVVFGVGLGLVIPNLPKLVSTRYGRDRGGFATGVYSTGLITGSVAGVYATKPLADALGSWRWALLVWAVLGTSVMAAWALLVSPVDPRPRLSETGFRSLVRRRELWVLAFLFAAGNASYFFLVGNYPPYLTSRGLGLDAALGQLALLIAVGVPAIFLAPIMSDRLRARRPFLWGPHALIAALLFLIGRLPLAAILPVSIGLGLAEMAIFALVLLLPVDLFSPEEVGRGSGIVVSFAYVGALVGPLAAGIAVDLSGSFEGVLEAFALLSVLAALATFALPETGARGGRA
ncbi:MAG: MFS transporter [Methanobacteriota archaeon]|nr:MAG: MFS transporter [Euryarchaeota archaeon]